MAESIGLVIKLLEQPLKSLCGGGSAWQQWEAEVSAVKYTKSLIQEQIT